MSIDRRELLDAATRALSAGVVGDAAATWRVIVDSGWLGAALSEEIGGLGLGAVARGAIGWALGHALAPGPFIAQTAALAALAAGPRSAPRDALMDAALSGAVVTLSLVDDVVDDSGAGAALRAVPDADGPGALLAFSERGARASLIPLGAPGLDMQLRPLWDETRRLFDVRVRGQATALGETIAEGDVALAMRTAAAAAVSTGLAADSLGAAAAILTRTIDYLGTRRQFDRPLAMFQALKHRAADLKTHLAAADALLWRRLAEPAPSLVDLAALKAHASAVCRLVSEEAIQLHGGVGLTEEFYCHRYLKRALLNGALGVDDDDAEAETGRVLLRALAAERKDE